MTLLSMIQTRVVDRIGLSRPATIVGNSDSDARLLLSIANEVGEDLAKIDWPILLKYATYLSVATQFQNDLSTIAPDFDRQEGETLWNFTLAVYSRGPLTPQEWQLANARRVAGPYSRFQLRQNPSTFALGVFFDVVPTAGQTFGFGYYSNAWAVNTTGGAPPVVATFSSYQADTDTSVFNETLIAKGIRAYYKREKGLFFEDDMADFEDYRDTLLAQQRAQRVASMTPTPPTLLLGEENVQEGSWPQ